MGQDYLEDDKTISIASPSTYGITAEDVALVEGYLTKKHGLGERWVDCTVLVTATENQKFRPRVIASETFRLCARSEFEASQLASGNVRILRGFVGEPGSVQVSTQVITSLPVFWGDIEAARIARADPQGWKEAGEILDRAIEKGLFR